MGSIYFANVAIGKTFKRGDAVFRKTDTTKALCLEVNRDFTDDFDEVGVEYDFGLSVVVQLIG